ncbi:flavin reductase family protein [Sphingobacterium sp. HJSM2_6]|uniref:flavin reductase family protein n=1 Tax=Sphingobacterium sp. HJSM2_6 TaxID=3366264 RepID=UPI003BEE8794
MPNKSTKTFYQEKDRFTFDNLIKYAVAPRPICFASTIDTAGNVNLSPFSYFNFMSQNPPICVFSPLSRMRDGSHKHTLENIQEVPEVVINIVNFSMVQQQSLASTEYAKGINEFTKAGLHEVPSLHIKPARVAEAPIQLECKVREVIEIASIPGAGNLVIAEVICMHIQEHLLTADNQLHQADLDLVARLGGDWYCRVTKDNLFQVPKPLRKLGIGIDQLPEHIRKSPYLSGNHLALLANIEHIPTPDPQFHFQDIWSTISKEPINLDDLNQEISHNMAMKYLDNGDLNTAWQILLIR